MSWVKQITYAPPVKKYSQCGEEGYLDFILQNIPNPDKFLVDLGAGDGYSLSNSRYFIEKGYKAILIDGDSHNNEEVNEHFITMENIIELLQYHLCPLNFDLLCIDLDGNDLYILDEVVHYYKPKVVIAEFNPIWGASVSKVIPYNPKHTWNNDDYYGFSFSAGIQWAYKNGYTCIFQNDNLNMYFMRNDVLMESLGINQHIHIFDHVNPVHYSCMQGHKPSGRTDWIDYK